ncbi:MAG: nitrite reductase small subunit NirD [Candidatus Omnitrophica bacterium]|nr:nitrite reductase small subunit NirD [Candidatus Omnitrophota bacterium]
MDKKTFVNLGRVDQIALGHGRCFVVGGEEIAVFRLRDGKLAAVENRCPHRQGPLSEGLLGSGKVVCPLHGHKFDLASGEGMEKGECVRTFEVREQDGEIILDFSAGG